MVGGDPGEYSLHVGGPESGYTAVAVRPGTATPARLDYAIPDTPNQTGAWSYATPIKANPAIDNVWGYDGGRFAANSTSYFKPIDSMILNVKGQNVELQSFANVNAAGSYDPEGVFQCTSLVANYLHLLGFSKALNSIPNGKDVATKLTEGPNKEFFSPIDQSTEPKVGSIVSMNAGAGGVADGIGHVAIVKGMKTINENRITVNLLEQNIRLPGSNEFAVNRTIDFTKDANGLWSASHSISEGGNRYSVLNWTTPISLP
jgi:surface antigen